MTVTNTNKTTSLSNRSDKPVYHGFDRKFKSIRGFTIVELLVVIVVIGILASITIVSYSGVTQKAKAVSIQADLASAARQLKIFQITNGSENFPTAIVCPNPGPTEICLKSSNGNIYNYTPSNGTNPKTFVLTATNGALSYQVTDNTSPTIASVLTCPTGFIKVPGSVTYGTSDFCVMKYEAKADANSDGIGDTDYTTGYNTYPANTRPISASIKLVSSAAGYPVANISQTTAIAVASNPSFVADCPSGCHLMTEAEWMTVAQNVLSVPSNWSSGVVGTGYIYSGHNDNAPATALIADATGVDTYYLTGQTTGNQKRALTLTNGEVIWDLSGNVSEWMSNQTTGVQPTGMPVYGSYEWTAVSGGTFAVNPYPSGTGLSGSGSWNSTNGIGRIYGQTSDVAIRGHMRSGGWNRIAGAGVLLSDIANNPNGDSFIIGLRVSKQ